VTSDANPRDVTSTHARYARGMEIEARQVTIHGRVQGVAFRHHTKLRARELGLAGWVRNRADGSVEVWAEGPPAGVAQLLTWLAIGPPAARVERVEAHSVPPAALDRFVVLREDS
jgi:acylphosphatase